MSRILCVAVVSASLLASAGSALAGMNEGIAAVTVGDYAKAMSEFEPLAANGDAAAQYQLAKIYLEGHGPIDGVPRGIELMTSAANGSYPEAQAQLGLMYAMGLGVPVDNAKAYDWLNKAVTALPDGTRRTVAEANRDAVLKRMNGGKMPAVAAAPAATATSKPQEASAKSTTGTTAGTTMGATTTKTVTPVTTSTKPAVTETSATKTATTNAAKPAATQTTTSTATTSKPATSTGSTSTTATTTTTKPAASTSGTASATTKPAGSDTATKTPTTQVASAKAPDAATGSSTAAAPGVRIQLASLPSEELAWKAWKDLNGKYSTQLTGLTAIVQPADLGTKGTFYRVQTGPFDTVAKAQERCTTMKAAGLDCLVVGKP